MLILKTQNDEAKIKVQNREDLWYLSRLIEIGDLVEGSTLRKVKIGGTAERADVVKKPIFLKIHVTEVQFHPYTQDLRVSGEVAEGVEDVSKGVHHTFNVEEGSVLSIYKKHYLKHHKEILKEATENKASQILLCALERDTATFALLRKYGYEILGSTQGAVEKKMMNETLQKNFYEEVAKQLVEYSQRNSIQIIVLGSPAFWKDQLLTLLKRFSLPRIILATCSNTGKSGIEELLRRPEVQQALANERTVKEIGIVEEIFSEIAREGLIAYGLKETQHAVQIGAVRILHITDGCIAKMRAQEPEKLKELMNAVEDAKGDIVIISSTHEGGVRLDGLGGMAAYLRFKIG